ncbi:MAG TPA: helix-turn-helix domain-containing protein [Caulobacteraceae bacterium]|jgi:AcrR family transcriptional regulator|nr:helix-turn-helix domain-containing protein [Caulobacteraceae bacterium]
MPKRSDSYMEAQRRAIAEAALEVLLEKGMHETSLRDICSRAGVSIGALYIHFATKDDAVLAACELDHENLETEDVDSWEEYVAAFRQSVLDSGSLRRRRRMRLSLQFVGELLGDDHRPEGFAELFQRRQAWFRRQLTRLCDAGAISLPLGVERTASLHMKLVSGATYDQACTNEPLEQCVETLAIGLGALVQVHQAAQLRTA